MVGLLVEQDIMRWRREIFMMTIWRIVFYLFFGRGVCGGVGGFCWGEGIFWWNGGILWWI